jgi:hypothetical protein
MNKIRIPIVGGKIGKVEMFAPKPVGKIENAGKKLQSMWDKLNAPIQYTKYKDL